MTQIEADVSSEASSIHQKLDQLRQSFEDDVRRAPLEETSHGEDHVLLTLGGEPYGLTLRHIREILPVPAIVPVPNVPPSVLGIINFHGQILPVTTIPHLPEPAPDPTGLSRVIVTKGLPTVIGILVDSVDGIFNVQPDEVQPPPVTMASKKTQLLPAQILLDGAPVPLIAIEEMTLSHILDPKSHDMKTEPVR